jgi:plastocyanin
MATHDVTLEPASSGNADVTPHNLEDVDAGDIIEFTAKDSVFTVSIPKASELFADWTKPFWQKRIAVGTGSSEQTPAIKSGLTSKSEWEYSVYCEEKRDWTDKPDSSPPKIIII